MNTTIQQQQRRCRLALTTLTKARARWATFKLKVTDAVTRALYDKVAESWSVKDFGAKGDYNPDDGTGTDDTAAFKAALAACRVAKKPLGMPSGNYLITDTLDYYGNGLVGDGAFNTTLYFKSSGSSKTLFKRETSRDLGKIQGFRIYGEGIMDGQTAFGHEGNTRGWFNTNMEDIGVYQMQNGFEIQFSLFCHFKSIVMREVNEAVFFAGDRTATSFPSGWNSTWYNNMLQFSNCDFTSCNNVLDFIGVGLVMNNITMQQGVNGLKIYGGFGAGAHNCIDQLYTEFNTGTDIYLQDAELLIGNYFSMAKTVSPTSTVGIHAIRSTARITGTTQFTDIHKWRLQLEDNSRVIQDRATYTYLVSKDATSKFESQLEINDTVTVAQGEDRTDDLADGVAFTLYGGKRLPEYAKVKIWADGGRGTFTYNSGIANGAWRGRFTGANVDFANANTITVGGTTFTVAVNAAQGSVTVTPNKALTGFRHYVVGDMLV